jgi:hypothetical protein
MLSRLGRVKVTSRNRIFCWAWSDWMLHGAAISQWYANSQAGCRSLQEFKKISILELFGGM